MYRIYVNDKSILLTNVLEKDEKNKSFLLDEISIAQIMRELSSKKTKKIYLFHPKKGKLLKKFKKKLPVIQAAGGIVVNSQGDYLFIKRAGKWDLPKGKLDKGEQPEEAAVREVEEETGVNQLRIEQLRSITYHIFGRNGSYRLKETYWYDMYTDFQGDLVPQHEEGIEKAIWKKKTKIPKLMKNSYGNIKKLLSKERADCKLLKTIKKKSENNPEKNSD